MTDATLIRGGTLVLPNGPVQADILLRDGRIAALGDVACPGAQVIDARARLVLPGGVDPHAHVEQMSGMGLMNADTFESAHRSAAMGGTTTVISFAAQQRGERLLATVGDYTARADRGAVVDHAFHITVSDPDVPSFDDDLAALVRAGHRSIKIFTTYDIRLDDAAILRLMTAARAAGALVCVHAENHGMIGHATALLVQAGRTLPHHHALSHPRLAEIEAVERICRFAEYLDQPVMLFHISTVEALTAVRAARGRGVPVWAETCPHYLLSTAEVLRREGVEGAKWMCSPPQRQAADIDALWQGLALGDLSLVSSDHAPYRFDASGKLAAGDAPPFNRIANGMPGLQVRLPLMFDAIVHGGRGGLAGFVEAVSAAPARIYGLQGKGAIAPGMDADLVLWDADRRVTFGDNDLADNAGYNPWSGHTVTGWPDTVLLRGAVIVDRGRFVGKAGQGRWLRRDTLATPPTGRLSPDLAAVLGDEA